MASPPAASAKRIENVPTCPNILEVVDNLAGCSAQSIRRRRGSLSDQQARPEHTAAVAKP